MKKTIILLCGLVIATSCTKSIDEIDVNDGKNAGSNGLVEKTFTITNDVTKAYIDGKDIKWNAGDKIGIIDNVDAAIHEFTVAADSEGKIYAEITGSVNEGSTKYAAIYPLSAAKSADFTAGTITAVIPSTQTISGTDHFDRNALVCTAFCDGNSVESGMFNFKNAFSLLKFKMNAEGVMSAALKNSGAHPVAGETLVTIPSEGEVTSVCQGTECSIRLNANGSFVNGEEYYIALAPANLGSTMEMYYISETNLYRKTTANEFNFVRNAGYDIGEISGMDSVMENPIIDKEDLASFDAYADLFPSTYAIKLGADIDFGGDAWTTAAYLGSFDGNGHYIKGIDCSAETSNCSFISTLQYPASVTGLTIKDSKFNSTCASSANVSAIVGTLVGGTVKGCNLVNCEITSTGDNVGGVVGLLQYGDIENCSVDDQTAITGKYSVGSIVGCRKLNTEGKETNLKSCTSSASLTATGGYSSKSGIGGIAGCYYRTIPGNDNITGCEFSGTINTQLHAAGGIIGWIRGGADMEIHISQCKSTPAAMNVASTSKYIGGIVGYFEGVYGKLAAVDISECNSTCDISAGQNVGGIVGHVERTYVPLSITSCTASGKLVASISGAGGIIGALVTAYTQATAGNATIDKCISYVDASSVYAVSGICSYASVATGTVMTIRNSEYLGKTLEATGCNTKTYLAYNGGIVGWALVSNKATLNIFNDVSRVETIKYSSAAKSVGVGGILGAADSNGDVYISGCYSTIIKNNILCDGVKTKAISNYGGIFGVRVSGKLYLDYCYVDSSLKTDIGATKYLGTSASSTTNSGTYSSAADCLTKMNAYVTAAEDETLLSWEKGTTDDFPVHVGMTRE